MCQEAKLDLLSTIDERIRESHKSVRDSTPHEAEKQSQQVQELKQALERERSANKQFMAEKQQLLLQLTIKEDKIHQLVADNKSLISNIEELRGIVRNRQATIDHLKAMPTGGAEPTITSDKATQWPMTTITRPQPAPLSSPSTKNSPRPYTAPRQAEEAIPPIHPPSNSLKDKHRCTLFTDSFLKGLNKDDLGGSECDTSNTFIPTYKDLAARINKEMDRNCDFVVIHTGYNDLWKLRETPEEIVQNAHTAIKTILSLNTNAKIIVSEVLHTPKSSRFDEDIDKTNDLLRGLISYEPRAVFCEHPLFDNKEEGLYDNDGTHVNYTGRRQTLSDIRRAMKGLGPLPFIIGRNKTQGNAHTHRGRPASDSESEPDRYRSPRQHRGNKPRYERDDRQHNSRYRQNTRDDDSWRRHSKHNNQDDYSGRRDAKNRNRDDNSSHRITRGTNRYNEGWRRDTRNRDDEERHQDYRKRDQEDDEWQRRSHNYDQRSYYDEY